MTEKKRGKSSIYSNLMKSLRRGRDAWIHCHSQVNPICDVGVVGLVNKQSLPKRRCDLAGVCASPLSLSFSVIDPAVKRALWRRGINSAREITTRYIIPRVGGARRDVNPLLVPFRLIRSSESSRSRPLYRLARSPRRALTILISRKTKCVRHIANARREHAVARRAVALIIHTPRGVVGLRLLGVINI